MLDTRKSSRWLCLLLAVLLLWRLIGAPLSADQWQATQTALWQARIQLPVRLARVALGWAMLSTSAGAETQPDPIAGQAQNDVTLRVFDAENGALLEMPLEEYVCRVVSAEVPASYHVEALKAQAVAARTRAVRQMDAGCSLCEGADICTDSAHCQAFADEDDMARMWGESAAVYRARVADAVGRTAGEILTFGGAPITVLYHAISGGRTEDVRAVFGESLPYLVSVGSEGEDGAHGFYTDASFTLAEAADKLYAAFPGSGLTAENIAQRLTIRDHTESGRVGTLLIGDREIKATELRRALGLRSTWFTLSIDGDSLTFHQRGYGHGVGMSQTGANAMAADGADYRAILTHYYQGTELADIF